MLPSQTSYVKVLDFPSSFKRKLKPKLGNVYLYLNTTAITKYDCLFNLQIHTWYITNVMIRLQQVQITLQIEGK